MAKMLLTIQHNDKLFSPPVEEGVEIEWERTGSPGKLTFTTVKVNNADMSFSEGDAVCFAFYVATWDLVCYDPKGQEITGEDPVQAKKMTFSYQMKTAEKTYEAEETVTFRGKILYQRPDGI